MERRQTPPPGAIAWIAELEFPIDFRDLSKNSRVTVGTAFRTDGSKYSRVRNRPEYNRAVDDIAWRMKEAIGIGDVRPVPDVKTWIDIYVWKVVWRGKKRRAVDAINVLDAVADGLKAGLGIDDEYFAIWRLDWGEVPEDVGASIRVRIGQDFEGMTGGRGDVREV